MNGSTTTSAKRFLKGLFAGLGMLFALGSPPVLAAPTDTIGFTVSIVDVYPPAAVTDLAAAPTVTPGQVLLTWTAPDENGGAFGSPEPVTSYIVKYATFSVDSVGGSTTTWWNLASTAPFPPAVQAPGSPQTMVINLAPGTQYWFALQSADDQGNLSPIDTNAEAAGAPQANATTNGVADPSIPAPVAGLSVSQPVPGTFRIDWASTTFNTDGTAAVDIVGYRLYRSTSLFGGFGAFVSSVTGQGTSGIDVTLTPGQDSFYVVRAIDASGNESPLPPSNFLHFSPTELLGQHGRADDASVSRSFIPDSAMAQLTAGGVHYLLNVAPNADPVLNRDLVRTMATYTVGLTDPVGNPAPGSVAFQDPVMNVVLQYDTTGAPIDPTKVGVLWWNGAAWVKVGKATVDSILNTISFNTALQGVYQVRRFTPATSLTLDKASVFPRIFSPNGDGKNDKVYFVVENPNGVGVDGRILDVSGAFVADLQPAGAGAPTPDTLAWDGRDKSGNLVRAGVYIYQIKGEGKTIAGTVVIAQ